MLTINQYDGTPAIAWYRRTLAQKTIDALAKRNITGLYFESGREAAEAVLAMIPAQATVGFGGSVTLHSLGLYQQILEGPYRSFNRFDSTLTGEQLLEVQRQALLADWFLTGTNAITLDGRLVNIDGRGNRVAALLFGPKRVVVVCGTNKIVPTLDDALERVKQVACPLNARRLGLRIPCGLTGVCHDCTRTDQRMCNLITIVEGQQDPTRMTVVLVGETLGF
ncbi:MAG: lactate utilization protein [Bacillota bacterium]|nr:lactate utilization protein [Bacillota bacterium]